MAQPPRPFLTHDEIKALSEDERARAIAEWSSYNARLRMEQEQRAAQATYRGSRGRGSGGRGRGYYHYQPYSTSPSNRQKFSNRSTTFNQSAPLVASSAADDPRPVSASAAPNGTKEPEEQAIKESTSCPVFTATGVCKRPRCPHIHDPERTAICRRYLFKDNCPHGDACPLSHTPSPHRSPSCVHFQNGNCNKEDCRYAHVHVSPLAPVCEPFARLGYCDKGDTCTNRHAFECPDFTNNGSCEVAGCRLPHVVHAGRLRKVAGSRPSSEAETPPTPSSLDDTNSQTPDITANETEDKTDQSHALSQQADFIPFES
ncbi:hypothetical protein CC78DRAFT_539165 [Lojkania enalia]|uniref:C3H1-type domain-containing protein n=1 Tax=Lojkania enalia TaxID=147567 RepID=A0A9P4TQM4_9PLEO|nr:hypothetical protein CC78DRAFT_539165 [Didymosphaeria enalia]